MEPKQLCSESNMRMVHQKNDEVPSRDVDVNIKLPRKPDPVEIIITEPKETDKTLKTGNTGKIKKDTRVAVNDVKTNRSLLETNGKFLAKNPARVNLPVKGPPNEGFTTVKDKGKGRQAALIRLKGSVHTIQMLSKLSR